MRQPPTITWNFGSDVIMNDSLFSITVQDGSHMIQNGGDTPQPSMRSVLTIDHPNRTHEGSYICSVKGGFNGLRVITLQVMESRSIESSSNTVHVSYSLWKHVCSYTQVVPHEGCVLKDRIINTLSVAILTLISSHPIPYQPHTYIMIITLTEPHSFGLVVGLPLGVLLAVAFLITTVAVVIAVCVQLSRKKEMCS